MTTLKEKDVICQDCVKNTDCPILDMLAETIAYMAICSSYEREKPERVEDEQKSLFFLRNGQ